MLPRPYQQQFIEKVESGWKEFKRQLGVAPTGSGKTIIFSHLAHRLQQRSGGRTLILAHREELIDQAIHKLKAATGIFADKEKAEYRASLHAPVVVASVQTMVRRLDRWPADHFELVVADEAHHSISNSWRTVLDHFTGNILGVTATADRGDKRSLGEFYENIADEIQLLDLIKQGFLSPVSIRSLPIKIDLNQVHSLAGDFDAGELGNVLEPFLDQIAAAIKGNVGNRKTLCFLPLIATSKKFVTACRAVGLSAEHVDGESEDRQEKLAAFARTDFQLLSNAMLLTEGYDCPDISCVVVLRPTRSRPLFAQMVGRGTRTAPGKSNLLLLDFLFLHETHEIIHPASLIAADAEEAAQITELAQETGGEDVDLMELQQDARHEREEALRKKLEQMAKRKAKFISAEEFAIQHHQLEIAEYEPTMKWERQPISDKQLPWIEKAGVDPESVKGKGQASKILDVYFKELNQQPATNGQRWMMRKANWRSADGKRGPGEATRGDAREFFASQNKPKQPAVARGWE